jgi:tetratricopeptide (TPR) repeat protein
MTLRPSRAPDERRRLTDRYGALTLDGIYGGGEVIASIIAPYHDLDTLKGFADGNLKRTGEGAQYHSYQSRRKRDLVFERNLLGGADAFWWTPAGLEPVTNWSAEDDAELVRDAALREVAGTLESQGIQAAFAAIEKAIRVAAGRRELLQFAGNCVAVGKLSLAGAIVGQFPGDDQALLLDARITMKLVNSGQWGGAELARAAQQLNGLVQRQPRNLEARLLWCDAPRFGGDITQSVIRFEALLRDFPQCDAAHYSLGAIFLAQEPARALEHFAAGEKLAPKDADYPMGRARALVALGRKDEARRALGACPSIGGFFWPVKDESDSA